MQRLFERIANILIECKDNCVSNRVAYEVDVVLAELLTTIVFSDETKKRIEIAFCQ